MAIEKINIAEKFSIFTDHWDPKIIAELNGQHVKLGKFKGEFKWHKHDNEDEMFLVMKGNFIMKLREKNIALHAGEMIVIPKGVEHCPVAEEEVHVILFEPASTLNTGDQKNEFTKVELKWI